MVCTVLSSYKHANSARHTFEVQSTFNYYFNIIMSLNKIDLQKYARKHVLNFMLMGVFLGNINILC